MNVCVGSMLKKLDELDDGQIKEALIEHDLGIDENKYQVAFSSYGVAAHIAKSSIDILKPVDSSHTDSVMRGIQHSATILFCAYTTFVYMRSKHLEKGLDTVSANSVLDTYKNIFRSGSKKQCTDTLAQRIRNALCHGTFEISSNHLIFRGNDNDKF